jgi:predicted HD phosphohydrolase
MPKVAELPELDALLERIAAEYPDLEFIESAHFGWHAGRKHVSFRRAGKNPDHSMWALLHELGHAILGHTDYKYDVELLKLEAAAWDKARVLASHYGVEIDENYIQDCLDTYRDWLHLRATCPACFARSLQASERLYRCFNCQAEWSVTRSRLCRPYRLQKA